MNALAVDAMVVEAGVGACGGDGGRGGACAGYSFLMFVPTLLPLFLPRVRGLVVWFIHTWLKPTCRPNLCAVAGKKSAGGTGVSGDGFLRGLFSAMVLLHLRSLRSRCLLSSQPSALWRVRFRRVP